MEEIIKLPNIGSTCFINVIVQLIYSTDDLKNQIINKNIEWMKIFEYGLIFETVEYCRFLRFLFKNYNPEYTYNSHQDCEEFLTILLDKINIPNKLLKYVRTITPLNSNENTSITEESNVLSLSICQSKNGVNTIYASLLNFMMEIGETHVLSVNFTEIGSELIISLKRFKFDGTGLSKDNSDVEIEDQLLIMENDQVISMKLIFVIVHLGDLNMGHYVCYRSIEDQWYFISDDFVEKCENPKFEQAYMLVYSKHS